MPEWRMFVHSKQNIKMQTFNLGVQSREIQSELDRNEMGFKFSLIDAN